MIVIESIQGLFEWRANINNNQSIGLIPTMGGLHDGHLSLIRKSLRGCDISIVSVFLNPKQFGKKEDLKTYPSDLASDLKQLELLGVDCVFTPTKDLMYLDDDVFVVLENKFSSVLEGQSRPDFFPGVLTVVSKLFNMTRPDNAYFGKKDAQQLILIGKLVEHMKYPINIVACDTVRENNGLAMSSRNAYLDIENKERAKIIYLSLLEAKKMLDGGERNYKKVKKHILSVLTTEDNIVVDYISIANSTTLQECDLEMGGRILISIAVFCSGVRLIDNLFYNTKTTN